MKQKKPPKKIETDYISTVNTIEAVVDVGQFCVKMKNGKYVFFSEEIGHATICDTIGFDIGKE